MKESRLRILGFLKVLQRWKVIIVTKWNLFQSTPAKLQRYKLGPGLILNQGVEDEIGAVSLQEDRLFEWVD